MSGYREVFIALNQSGARYVVVGGLAVVLHGHARLTMDVDLVVDLEASQAASIIEALAGIGLTPRVPVEARSFADAEQRERWIREKNMQVFTLIDRSDPRRTVDLFVREPLPFVELYERSLVVQLQETGVRIASIPDLITMKEAAGRDQDRADIEALRRLVDGADTVEEWPVTYEATAAALARDVAKLSPDQRLTWLEAMADIAVAQGRTSPKG